MVPMFDESSCAAAAAGAAVGVVIAVVTTMTVVATPAAFVVVDSLVITLVCGGRVEEEDVVLGDEFGEFEPDVVEVLRALLGELLEDVVELADEDLVDPDALLEIVAVAVPSSMSMNLTFCAQQDLLASFLSTSGRFLSQQ